MFLFHFFLSEHDFCTYLFQEEGSLAFKQKLFEVSYFPLIMKVVKIIKIFCYRDLCGQADKKRHDSEGDGNPEGDISSM